jgi:hypothetical protein
MRTKAPPRKSQDEELLFNMVFGTLPLAHAGDATKVHDMHHPQRIVLTKLTSAEA